MSDDQDCDKMRGILARIHEAIGESEQSDDETLPDVVAQIVRERQERIDELEHHASGATAMIMHLKKRLAEAEAGAATMRSAINRFQNRVASAPDSATFRKLVFDSVDDFSESVTDAGRDFLDVVEKCRAFITAHGCNCVPPDQCSRCSLLVELEPYLGNSA